MGSPPRDFSSQLSWIVVLVLLLLAKALSLQFFKLDVPGAIFSGDPVWLGCQFDQETDNLYSVKWYKNNEEFYRYLPRDVPPGQKYDLLGVYVDLALSNLTHVLLRTTDLNTEGTYGCEVSADAPSFRTFKAEKDLRVYVLPPEDPQIRGIAKQYEIGDELNLTCTSGPAKPAPTLRWYINGREAPKIYQDQQPLLRHTNGLVTSRIGLQLLVEPSVLWGGNLKVRCLASVSQVYSKTSEELVVGDSTTPAITSGDEGPNISGGLMWYNIGDIVDINCTAPKSANAAELKWFINDQETQPDQMIPYPVQVDSEGLEVSVLGLKFRVQKKHLRNAEMRLRCTAALSKVIKMSSEETVLGASQQSSSLHVVDASAAAHNSQLMCPWLLLVYVVLFYLLSSVLS